MVKNAFLEIYTIMTCLNINLTASILIFDVTNKFLNLTTFKATSHFVYCYYFQEMAIDHFT